MTHSGTEDPKELFFLLHGRIYKIPASRMPTRGHTPVKLKWKEFEETVCGWRSVPFSVDSFLGAANMKGKGYCQRNILPVQTQAGWVWASSLEVQLDAEERSHLGLGEDVGVMGGNIMLAWPASKASHAWESAAEASRLDSVYRTLVDCEPTRSIMSPFPLNLENVPDAVEVALDNLSDATRVFLSCVTPCQCLAIPRFEGDDYVDRVHAHVAKKQGLANFRRVPEQTILSRILSGLPQRGDDNRIDWMSPALDKMLSAEAMNARRRMTARLWTGAQLARTAMPRKRPREEEDAQDAQHCPPQTREREASSTSSSPHTAPASPPHECSVLLLTPVREPDL